MPIYAAYGTNLDPERMLRICPHSPIAGTGWLHGWRLTFGGEDLGWEGALATVVEDASASVFVMLYDVTREDEAALDSWEGVDLGAYGKVRLRVETLEGPALAWLYVLDDYEGGLPSARYIGILAEAADRAGAPSEYVTDILTRPCRSTGP